MRNKNKITLTNNRLLALLVGLCLSPPQLFFAKSISVVAQKLINNMSRAVRELNYDGIFVYRRDTQLVTMRLIIRLLKMVNSKD